MKNEVKLCQVFTSCLQNCDTSRSEFRTPPVCVFNAVTVILTGVAVAQWLKYSATNRQVAGSIPDGVIGIFQ